MNVIFFSHPLVDKLAEECIQLTPAFDIKLFENERDEDFAVFEDPDEAPNPFIGGNNFQTLVRLYLSKCSSQITCLNLFYADSKIVSKCFICHIL